MSDTFKILRTRFPANEYCLLQEVRDAAGFDSKRSLDFMLINYWASRGLSITGIERKSHRNDWLRELKNPAKQENHYKYCDRFCLLTDNPNVAFLPEIPDTWGWWHIQAGRLQVMKECPKLDPLPIPRTLLICMLKRAADLSNYVPVSSVQEEVEKRLEGTKLSMQNRMESENSLIKHRLEGLQAAVDAFEKESGINIRDKWSSGNYGKVVGQLVRSGGVESVLNQLTNIRNGIDRVLMMQKEQGGEG